MLVAISPGSQSQDTGHHGLFPSAVGKPAMSYNYNPLILPSTGHAGDLGDTQLHPRGSRRSTCLNLPRDPVPTRLSHLSLLRDPSAWNPRKSTCLHLPGDLIPERLSCLSLLRDQPFQEKGVPRRLSCFSLPEDLQPDPGTPGSQVSTVLGRISFRKTHP